MIESERIRLRTREGMKVAKARGRLRGKRPCAAGAAAGHQPPCQRESEDPEQTRASGE